MSFSFGLSILKKDLGLSLNSVGLWLTCRLNYSELTKSFCVFMIIFYKGKITAQTVVSIFPSWSCDSSAVNLDRCTLLQYGWYVFLSLGVVQIRDHSHTSLVVGTSLLYRPGLLVGGTLEHDCSKQRAIGYFIEPLVMLAPFMKKPLCITLRGLTNGPEDPSVSYRLAMLLLLFNLC